MFNAEQGTADGFVHACLRTLDTNLATVSATLRDERDILPVASLRSAARTRRPGLRLLLYYQNFFRTIDFAQLNFDDLLERSLYFAPYKGCFDGQFAMAPID